MTNYPQAIEENLEILSEILTSTDYEYPIHEQCIREVFGPVFMQQWLDGAHIGFVEDDYEQFNQLLKLTIARSLIEEMRDEGLVDTIEDPQKGDDVVFLTQKGKSIAQLLNTANLN